MLSSHGRWSLLESCCCTSWCRNSCPLQQYFIDSNGGTKYPPLNIDFRHELTLILLPTFTFTEAEVRRALKALPYHSALGPDGMRYGGFCLTLFSWLRTASCVSSILAGIPLITAPAPIFDAPSCLSDLLHELQFSFLLSSFSKFSMDSPASWTVQTFPSSHSSLRPQHGRYFPDTTLATHR